MTGPEHYRRAEELAAEAHRLLGQGDGQATAGVWAAVAQTHAVLALAAATAVGGSVADGRAWADAAGRWSPALPAMISYGRRRSTSPHTTAGMTPSPAG
jgi:hypothetical protein